MVAACRIVTDGMKLLNGAQRSGITLKIDAMEMKATCPVSLYKLVECLSDKDGRLTVIPQRQHQAQPTFSNNSM